MQKRNFEEALPMAVKGVVNPEIWLGCTSYGALALEAAMGSIIDKVPGSLIVDRNSPNGDPDPGQTYTDHTVDGITEFIF